MRYWWVNHSQTFRHEFEGHYIWSPKRKRDGSRNRFYDFLREVVPGDLVLSYASGLVQGAGFAISYCHTCPRPAEFGHIGEAWDIIGWRVDVAFQLFSQRVRPKDHLPVVLPFLKQERFAPLRDTGDGLQHVYLTSVSDSFAQVIIGLAGETNSFSRVALHDASSPLIERELSGQLEWEEIEQQHILKADIPVTTRRALVQARIGQGLFKDRVSRMENRCRLTFVHNPAHLVGSHIKPWRESTNEERLNGANGLLLTPTADHLFDRGFISFDDNGEVLISPVADVDSLRRMGLDPAKPPRALPFNIDQKHFLDHHRKEIFLSASQLV
jgi:hypothetical protein